MTYHITLYTCPLGHILSPFRGKCIECESSLVATEYVPYVNETTKHPSERLYIDDDGYICAHDQKGLEGPGIWWTLHYYGWEAYPHVDPTGDDKPIYIKGGVEFPTDDELAEAASRYEEWCKTHKGELNDKNSQETKS
jgi:hypothetical protein